MKYLKLTGNWSTYSIDMFTAMCAHKIPIQSATVATEISNCNICRILPPTRHIFKILCRESPQLPLEKFFRVVDENLGLGRVVISHPLLLSQKCQFELTENVNDMCFFLLFFLVFPLFCGSRTMLCASFEVVHVGLGQRRWPQAGDNEQENVVQPQSRGSGLFMFFGFLVLDGRGERGRGGMFLRGFREFQVLGFAKLLCGASPASKRLGGEEGRGALRHRGIRSRPTPDHPFSLISGFRFP